jgi:putative colanic acid biosynthesis acetyltransferase WcaF
MKADSNPVDNPPAAEPRFVRHAQSSAFESPHSRGRLITMFLWGVAWKLLCAWTPKPLNPWRLMVLRAFGARIHGYPFVHQSAHIHFPANLILHDRACLGEGAVAYTQGVVELRARCTVAQEAYLCTGTHDFSDPALPLVTAPIVVGEDAFIGARAFVLPGVTIGEGGVVGAASVATKNVPAWTIVAGNPARVLRQRNRPDAPPAKETP